MSYIYLFINHSLILFCVYPLLCEEASLFLGFSLDPSYLGCIVYLQLDLDSRDLRQVDKRKRYLICSIETWSRKLFKSAKTGNWREREEEVDKSHKENTLYRVTYLSGVFLECRGTYLSIRFLAWPPELNTIALVTRHDLRHLAAGSDSWRKGRFDKRVVPPRAIYRRKWASYRPYRRWCMLGDCCRCKCPFSRPRITAAEFKNKKNLTSITR